MTWWKRPALNLDQEIEAHIVEATRDNMARGLPEDAARRAALRQFGNLAQVKEDVRRVWIPLWVEQFSQDALYGFRLLHRFPAFTTIVIFIFGLTVASNTAIFTLVNEVLLYPPGVSNPERLTSVRVSSRVYPDINVSPSVFADIRDSRQIFDHAAAANFESVNYSAGTDPVRLPAARVSSEWFDVFGSKPIIGRVFSPEEDQPLRDRVVVLSYRTWVQLFGANPNIIGQTIELNDQPYKIIGVMDRAFEWPRQTAVWIPLALPPEVFTRRKEDGGNLQVIARTRSGVSYRQAASYVNVLSHRATDQNTPDSALLRKLGWTMVTHPFTEAESEAIRRPLLVLFAGVGIVLLIACVNVAGLMLARTAARMRELRIRVALGASRPRILRQVLSESLLLSGIGGLLGLLLAPALTALLLKTAPGHVVQGLSVWPDAHVVTFTMLAVILSGLVLGIFPALQMSKTSQLADGGRTMTTGRNRQRVLAGLVIVESGLAVMLLIGAGLLLRTLHALENVSPGFDPHGIMTGMISLPERRYPDGIGQANFYRVVLDHLTPNVGVRSAAIGIGMPFSNWAWGIGFGLEGERRLPTDPLHEGVRQWVTPRFFETLRIPIKTGHNFTDDDRVGTAPVAIIDETLLHQFWSGENPARHRISNGRNLISVIGVVPHIETRDVTGTDALGRLGSVYFNLFQRKERLPFPHVAWIIARASGDPYTLIGPIRNAVHQADANLPVSDLKPLDELIADTLAPQRFVFRILEWFAVAAMCLASLGLYGVIDFSMRRRTREIGIQIALGAPLARIRREIILEGVRLTLIGIAAGIGATFLVSRSLTSILYSVSPRDPTSFILAPLALLPVALLACYLPAQRAVHLDPAEALRIE